jgi:hypothetical protein
VLHAVINPIPTGAKQTIELPGRHARIEAHIPQPSLYVNVDEGTGGPPPLPPDQRWKIIRIDQTKDGRVISKVKINLLGKSSESQNVIPATVQKLSTSDWVKITPSQPLALGQYALVEMISRDEINMNVWDFGINPSGPENPATGDQPKKNPLDNGYTKLGDDDTEQQPTKQKKPKN